MSYENRRKREMLRISQMAEAEVGTMIISDEMMKHSAERACEIYLNTIDSQFAEASEYEFSSRFKRRMRKMIREQNRTPQMRRFVSIMQKVAVFVVVFLLGATTVTMSVEAYRTSFINFVKKVTQKDTTYEYSIGNTPYLKADLTDSKIGYIPEIFELTNEMKSTRNLYVHYTDNEGHDFSIELTYVDSSSNGFISIDTEGSEIKNVSVNGNDAVLNIKEDEKQLIWSINNVLCNIVGNIEEEEIMSIAESVEVFFESN